MWNRLKLFNLEQISRRSGKMNHRPTDRRLPSVVFRQIAGYICKSHTFCMFCPRFAKISDLQMFCPLLFIFNHLVVVRPFSNFVNLSKFQSSDIIFCQFMFVTNKRSTTKVQLFSSTPFVNWKLYFISEHDF